MRVRNVLLVLLICILFQVTLPNTSWLYEAVRVQFVLIAVVIFSLEQDWFGAAMTGVAGGFMMDVFSGGRIGVYALSYGLVGLLLGRVQERLFKENMLTIATVMAVASVLSSILVSNVLGLYGIPVDYFGQFGKRVLPSAAANAIVGCAAVSIVRRVRRGIRAVQKRYYW